jgi:2,4-dienoyl-CoA reductase (NADPH2)
MGLIMHKLKSLFEPVRVGKIELKNRIVMAAMGIGGPLCPDGRVSERLKALYAERAKGGVGLIICNISSYPELGGKVRGVAVHKNEFIPGLRELTDTVHVHGGKIAAQLVQRIVWRKQEDGTPEMVGPSEITPGAGGRPGIRKLRPLTIAEIEQIVEEKGEEARRCRDAGFDAIELHANVGTCLASYFISSYTNKRTDRYGGSIENRYRFLIEILENARKRAGKDYTITCRISGADFLEGGSNLEDAKKAAPMLEKAGFNAINVTTGWHESPVAFVQQGIPQGAFVYLAEEIKKVVNIPVIGGTSICDPRLADRFIAEGKIDLVYMARPLLADPELPNKAKEGRFADIRPCILCCRCLDAEESDQPTPVSCSVNPRLAKELDYPNYPLTKKKKKVIVVGGGPGGMEAARVAALRGHEVIIYEQNLRLGGSMILASIVNSELERLVKYMRREIRKLPVQIVKGKEVTPRLIDQIKPDVVVLAVGGTAPESKEITIKNVFSSHSILEVMHGRSIMKVGVFDSILWKLTGLLLRYSYNPTLIRRLAKFNFPFGKKVVVIGGGLAGCELAEFLLDRGKKVTIIGESERVGDTVGPTTRWVFKMKFKEHGVGMIDRAKVEEITEKGVKIRQGNTVEFIEANTVIPARNLQPNHLLGYKLKGKVPTIYDVGDCATPALVKESITQGFLTGMEI